MEFNGSSDTQEKFVLEFRPRKAPAALQGCGNPADRTYRSYWRKLTAGEDSASRGRLALRSLSCLLRASLYLAFICIMAIQ